MLVDHRAVLMLANAYRYNRLKTANAKNKKVTRTPKVVSSSSPKVVEETSDVAKRINSKKAILRKSGKVKDAVNIFKEMYS